MTARFDDGISNPTDMLFDIVIINDYPLTINQTTLVENFKMIVYSLKFIKYDASDLFNDPEGLPFEITYLSSGETPLPYFMMDYLNGTLKLNPLTTNDVGVHAIVIVGTDNAGWTTTIPFSVFVNPCYYKCSYCWDSDYNTCLECQPGYYKYGFECID